ncbi:LCP family protein [Frankia sp. Cpl3]|nr:LCP family protein [Frankia sp. Cpl3]
MGDLGTEPNGSVAGSRALPADGGGVLPFDLTGARQRPTAAKRLRYGLAMLLSVLVLFGSVGGWAIYAYLDSRIERVAIGDLGKRPPARADEKTFLLVGTDSREGAGDAYGDVGGQRSDTTILAHVGADDRVTMVSFPRDMFVLIPEYTDGDGDVHPPQENKFNQAIALGGATLLIKLVERLTGLRVDHYVAVDLVGFRAVSEAVGGVEVCIRPLEGSQSRKDEMTGRTVVSTNTNDPYSGFRGGPGTIEIKGEQALAFVRQRYGLPNWDIDRIKRQQYFLSRILAKVTEGGVLSDPGRVASLLGAVGPSLDLGAGTELLDLRRLASRLQGITTGSLGMQTVPVHTATRAEGAVDNYGLISNAVGAVQSYNQADLDALFASLTGGSDAGGDAAAGAGAARISVVNGTRTAGLAGRVTRALTSRGVSVDTDTDTAAGALRTDYRASWIRYGTGAEATARMLLTHIPGAKLLADNDVDGVQLIVGSTFRALADPAPDSGDAGGGGAGTGGALAAGAAGVAAGEDGSGRTVLAAPSAARAVAPTAAVGEPSPSAPAPQAPDTCVY